MRNSLLKNVALVNLNRKLGSRFGWQLKRYVPDLLEARMHLINSMKPDLILDGGANRGQWAREVRAHDKSTPIIAFEPVRESFEVLSKLNLSKFLCENVALSDYSGITNMNVSGSIGMQSSIGLPNEFYRAMYPDVLFSKTEKVRTVTLDSLPQLRNKSIYLKLDVEGHEWQVLNGATELLSDPRSIIALEIETSVNVTREKERTHYQIVPWLESIGFQLFHLSTPGVRRDGKMNFIDCILIRR